MSRVVGGVGGVGELGGIGHIEQLPDCGIDRLLGVPTAHAAVIAIAARELTEPEPVAVLGIDETRRAKPRWDRDPDSQRWVRTDPWDTGFVDLSGDQGLLGQVEGRTSACVVTWLKARTPEFRAGIRFVAIDPAAVYAHAVATRRPAPERNPGG